MVPSAILVLELALTISVPECQTLMETAPRIHLLILLFCMLKPFPKARKTPSASPCR